MGYRLIFLIQVYTGYIETKYSPFFPKFHYFLSASVFLLISLPVYGSPIISNASATYSMKSSLNPLVHIVLSKLLVIPPFITITSL